MIVRSLGFRTDLIFTRFDGVVIDRGNYVVVRTDTNPNYFWGNLLIFGRPPREGDLAAWEALFKTELPDPRIYHRTFAWDSTDGEVGELAEFLDAGFALERSVCLTASAVHAPPKSHPGLDVRPLRTDAEWQEAIGVQIACGHPTVSLDQWERFARNQMSRYRKMTDAGLGHWFGGFLEGRLVAGLGLFGDGEGVGRFQLVSTHPSYRRLGACGALVHGAARFGLERMGLDTLVMVADEEYHAARIYESVGFKPTERMAGVCRWDASGSRE